MHTRRYPHHTHTATPSDEYTVIHNTLGTEHRRPPQIDTDPFVPNGRHTPRTVRMRVRACWGAVEQKQCQKLPAINVSASIQGPAAGDPDYGPQSSVGMVAEPTTEFLLCVNAGCANLNRQSLFTRCSNALSIPPLVRPSASMSRVSTQCIRLIMPWLRRSRTEIRCSLSEHS